jgi:ribosomal protein S12 methylthiotransferase
MGEARGKTMKFRIVSLGCAKNLVESEYIRGGLEAAGHSMVDDADTVIVNTCAFIADAARESIETILEEAKAKGDRKIIVTGCLVERYGEKLSTLLPEVDLFLSRACYPEAASLIAEKGIIARPGGFSGTFPRQPLTRRPTAYLKIQEGCDNRCTYCAVPAIRGPLKSTSPEGVLREFEWLLDQGFREINIIGQDITSYGRDTGSDLTHLLGLLLKTPGDYFLRLLYMHPRHVEDSLLEVMARDPRVIPYVDIPVQHSEDRILALMGRGYGRAYLEGLLGKIRKAIPGVTLRTSIIVGFPTETEEEFQGLLAFVSEWEFDNLGAFVYSREEGTPAAGIKGQVKVGTKRKRFNRIMELQREISRKRLKRLLGQTMPVIVEDEGPEYMTGRLIIQAPDIDGVAFVRGDCERGLIYQGKVVKTLDYDVIVEVV